MFPKQHWNERPTSSLQAGAFRLKHHRGQDVHAIRLEDCPWRIQEAIKPFHTALFSGFEQMPLSKFSAFQETQAISLAGRLRGSSLFGFVNSP
jgi:hypothetical protein